MARKSHKLSKLGLSALMGITTISGSALLVNVNADIEDSQPPIESREVREIKEIHINSYDGSDENDGLTSETSVSTFAKAKSLMSDGDILYIDKTVQVNSDEVWDFTDLPNSKVVRNGHNVMVQVNEDYTLTLKNITLDGNNLSIPGNCGAIIQLGKIAGTSSHGAKLIIDEGTVLENNINTKLNGGAVVGYSYNTVTMNKGATIRNNGTIQDCAEFGGGIALENHGKFIMNGGTISNNHAVRGGGVCLIASSMEMHGGTIKDNSANSTSTYLGHYGGGIYLSNFQDWSTIGGEYSRYIAGEVTFDMYGGTISNNKATYQSGSDLGNGGAIATFPQWTLGYEESPKITINIHKGTISDNEAYDGGGVSAYFSATEVNIKDANFKGNTAQNQGGALNIVYNAKAVVEDSTFTDNKSKVGGAINLNVGDLQIKSAKMSGNDASGRGGAIFISAGTYKSNTSVCTILDSDIKGNTAANGEVGSDAIYQGGTLNIGEKTSINKNNDVYLPTGKVINVIKPLSVINRHNPVSITSVEDVVESLDGTTAGTKLVNYFDEAGGIDAAYDAELDQYYIASGYMREGLLIGKSINDTQLNYMTYVQKIAYRVTYVFESGTEGMDIPEEVKALTPIDESQYLPGTVASAVSLEKRSVKVKGGLWVFKGYDADEKTVDSDVKFLGMWYYYADAAEMNEVPSITAEDKTLNVGDKYDPLIDVTAQDKEDGDITKDLIVLYSNVDTSKEGVYTVQYQVTDSGGATVKKTITVTVGDNKGDFTGGSTNTNEGKENPTGDKIDTYSVVKTGDMLNIATKLSLVLVSGAIITIAAIRRKNKKK